MARHFELIVFTASLSKYAEPLMLQLDPHQLCSEKLFREHCTFYNNIHVKDLTRLGRNMKDVIIVDNSPAAYLFQPENAIPILSWYDDPHDTELLRLTHILERLAYEDDVRKVIRALVTNNKIDPKQEQIYLSMPTKHKRDQSHPAGSHSSNPLAHMNSAPSRQEDVGEQISSHRSSKIPEGPLP